MTLLHKCSVVYFSWWVVFFHRIDHSSLLMICLPYSMGSFWWKIMHTFLVKVMTQFVLQSCLTKINDDKDRFGVIRSHVIYFGRLDILILHMLEWQSVNQLEILQLLDYLLQIYYNMFLAYRKNEWWCHYL